MWPVLLSDSFEQNSNGWPVGTETDSLADIAWSYPEGAYRWEAVARDSLTNPTAVGTLTPDWYGTPTLDPTSARLATATSTPLAPFTERRNIYYQNH